jgi:5'-nucleotidase / UDP-sugar diphosphatase
MTRSHLSAIAALLLAGAFTLSAQTAPNYTLTIVHVNDTHSKFEPTQTKLIMDLDDQLKAKPVYVELGGFPQAADIIKKLRAKEVNPVLVHAGDFVQGSLYFTKYEGVADLLFWNTVKPTVATLGNHEFDKGPAFLMNKWLGQTRFNLVEANVDFSKDPDLAWVAPKPFVIKEVGNQKIGFIGATTPETPFISNPGNSVVFNDPVTSVQKAVDELTKQGVNKIVLVSHLGYEVDKDLATKVAGVDVIVGGHSHTLLGDWKAVGLGDKNPYPTVLKDKAGDTTLVVQAWEWAKVVGDLKVNFDADGKVVSWAGAPQAVLGNAWFRVYDVPNPKGELKRVQFTKTEAGISVKEFDGKTYVPVSDELEAFYLGDYIKLYGALAKEPELAMTAGDKGTKALMADFQAGVKELQATVASQVGEDMKRGLNVGPGPVIADSMRAKTGAQIALSNSGGIRTDFVQGPLTVAQVYENIPFGNTLVLLKMTGENVVKAIEDGVDFAWNAYPHEFPVNPLLYVSGIKFDVNTAKPNGSRVSNAMVLDGAAYKPLDPAATYTVVVNNFMAGGGDKYFTLKATPDQMDTGMIDAEALLDYVQGKTLKNTEARINVVTQ